jgi:hypothetical protein
MATIINADNGVASGVPGLKYVSDSSGNLQLQTNGTNALLLDTSQYPSATVNGLGTGRIPAEQFYRLNSDLVGANATGAQNFLGVGVTLVGSTVYQFEGFFMSSKTAGTVSNIVSFLIGGTATFNSITYNIMRSTSTTSFVDPAGAAQPYFFAQTAAAVAVTGARTTATYYDQSFIKGTVSVNVGGTFVPQYQLSAAPGGAYTTKAGSYFKVSPLGASGSNISIGTWS